MGQKIKLYFSSVSDSIKVYAYPHTQPRETALGKNILYLFEDDFPEEEWDLKTFETKLSKIIKRVK